MSFYLNTPKGNISLKNLTQHVLTRLKLLFKILDAGDDRMLLQDIFQELGTVEESECLIEGTMKDKISHFMLRLACCQNPEMSVFFQNAESALFDWRFSCMTEQELCKLFKSLDPYLCIRTCCQGNKNSKCLQDDIFDILKTFYSIREAGGKWRTVVRKYLNGELSGCFYVPFQDVLRLVQQRDVHLKNGIASVPFCQLRTVVCDLFRRFLHCGIDDATRNLQTDDERILNLMKTVKVVFRQQFKEKIIHHNPRFHPITNRDIDGIVQYFPPCMSHAFWLLRRKHRLHHHTRIQLTLFLKELGLPIHEALAFWKNEYSQPASNHGRGCSHDWVHHKQRYTYNIRHLYGLEGSRINYRSHSCKYLQDNFQGYMEEGGCPFSHFDKDNLMKVLECTGSGENYKEIIELAADGCYNLACSKFLNKRVETLKKDRKCTKHPETELSEDKTSYCGNSNCSKNIIEKRFMVGEIEQVEIRCKDTNAQIVTHLKEDSSSALQWKAKIVDVPTDFRKDFTCRQVQYTQSKSIVAQTGVVTGLEIDHRLSDNGTITADDMHSEIRNDVLTNAVNTGEFEYTQCRYKKTLHNIALQKEEDSGSTVNRTITARDVPIDTHCDSERTHKDQHACNTTDNKNRVANDAQDCCMSNPNNVTIPFRLHFSKPLDYYLSYKVFVEKLQCIR